MKDTIFKFLTGALIFAGGGILNYFGGNPRILYFPAVALCLWISWMILSGVHTYVSKEVARQDAKTQLANVATSPMIITPEDFPPPQPITPPVPETKETAPSAPTQTASDAAHNINGDQINITAPNNSGTVIGKQTLVAPIGRHLSPNQKSILEATFLQFAGTKRLRVMAVMGDPESGAFAQEIVDCLPPNSRTGLLLGAGGKNIPGKIAVCIRNPSNPPPFANDVLKAFKDASISAMGGRDSSGPDENSIWIKVFSNQ